MVISTRVNICILFTFSKLYDKYNMTVMKKS